MLDKASEDRGDENPRYWVITEGARIADELATLQRRMEREP